MSRDRGFSSSVTGSASESSVVEDLTPPGRPVTVDVAGQGRIRLTISRDAVLGRSKDADVCVERDAEASSRHAALYFQGAVLMLRDLGSSNGTFLNGTRVRQPERVDDGDVVLVGRTEVRVYMGRI